ncbi:MAG: hypothetical protein AAFX02_09255 [Pseudomonadota bacterium]
MKRYSEMPAQPGIYPGRHRLERRGADFLVAHACFSCRVSFKQKPAMDGSRKTCPLCGGQMAEMGRGFKVPRKSDKEQWEKVRRLWLAGYRFRKNFGRREVPFPSRLREVDAFIRENPRHGFRLREYWPPNGL